MVSAIRHDSLPTHPHLPISPFQTDDRGWTNFERAEGQLIKPDSFCVDIGLFTVEKAYEACSEAFWWWRCGADRRGSRSRRSRWRSSRRRARTAIPETRPARLLVGSRRDAPARTRRLRHGAEQEGIYNGTQTGHRHQPVSQHGDSPARPARSCATTGSNGPMRSLRGWARRCATAARSRR